MIKPILLVSFLDIIKQEEIQLFKKLIEEKGIANDYYCIYIDGRQKGESITIELLNPNKNG